MTDTPTDITYLTTYNHRDPDGVEGRAPAVRYLQKPLWPEASATAAARVAIVFIRLRAFRIGERDPQAVSGDSHSCRVRR